MARIARLPHFAGVILACGCLIGVLGFGPRSGMGFLLTPMSSAHSWGRDVFALALAIQMLLWGAAQPFAGAIADRFGAAPVLSVGAVLYALGLAAMAYAGTPAMLHLSAGVMIGFGLAGSSFTVVIGAFGKLMPPQWRSLAFGAGTAAGSFGQFLFSPLAVALIDGYGWRHTLVIFAAIVLLIIPLSLAFAAPRANGAAAAATAPQQSLVQALTEALGHRSYWLLVLGFFTCGFQIFFIAVHLPAYLVDRGLAAEIGGWTLGVIGLFNMVGAITAGWLSALMPRRYLLSIHLFCTRGGDPRLHHAATERGRDPDLRGSAGPALALDRAAHLGPRHRHVRHSLARDAVRLCFLQPPDRRFPRRVAWRRAVRAHRILRLGLVAGDSTWPPVSGDQSADCGEAGAAPRCRSRLNPANRNPVRVVCCGAGVLATSRQPAMS